MFKKKKPNSGTTPYPNGASASAPRTGRNGRGQRPATREPVRHAGNQKVVCTHGSQLCRRQSIDISPLRVQDRKTRTMPVFMLPWFSNDSALGAMKSAAVYRAGQLFDITKLKVIPRNKGKWTTGTAAATLEQNKGGESEDTTQWWMYAPLGATDEEAGAGACDVAGCGGGDNHGGSGGAGAGGACSGGGGYRGRYAPAGYAAALGGAGCGGGGGF
jgi:hypothetical protein